METKDKVLENIEHIFSEYEENKKMFNDDTLVELFSIYKSLDIKKNNYNSLTL